MANLLEQIRSLKHEGEVAPEDPLVRVQATLKEVGEVRREVMGKRGLSWPELLEECRSINPALVDKVMSLYDGLDTGIYGRYLEGFVTKQILQDYYAKLNQWKELSMQMYQMISSMR